MILRFTHAIVSISSFPFFVLRNSNVVNIQFGYAISNSWIVGGLQFGAVISETIVDLLICNFL